MYHIWLTVGITVRSDQIKRRIARLIIKRIRIKDFGKDDRFEVSFDPQLAVLPAPSAKTILKAIGLVL